MKEISKLFATAVILIFCSCENNDDVMDYNNSQHSSGKLSERHFVGDSLKLENPYTVSNMKMSLMDIKRKNPDSPL